MGNLISKVYLEAFSHATEDSERVKEAILNLAPTDIRERISKLLITEITYGHYGNPIIIYKLNITEKALASKLGVHLLFRLNEEDKRELFRTLNLRLDHKRNMYLRLDKQKAFLGEIRLSKGGDDIKAVLGFLPHLKDYNVLERELRKLWENLTKR